MGNSALSDPLDFFANPHLCALGRPDDDPITQTEYGWYRKKIWSYCIKKKAIAGGKVKPVCRDELMSNKHDVESEGAKSRDHAHPRHHFWKRAHRDWRVWITVVLMIAMILVYVMTDDLSLRPGKRQTQPTPAANPP